MDTSAAAEETVNYTTVQPERGEYVKSVSVEASLYYPVTAELFCEKDNAYIQEILVKERQKVVKGETLLIYEIKVSDADVQELSLQLTRHQEATEREKEERLSELEQLQKEMEGLFGEKLELALLREKIMQTEYEEFLYLAAYQSDQYKMQIENLEQEVENNTLTAPFDGVIDWVGNYKSGDQAENGQLLIKMHTEEQYCLAVEDIAGNLRYNMEVTVTAGAQNDKKSYKGKVVTAYNVLKPEVPDGKVLIQLEEEVAPKDLQVGLQCHGEVEKLQDVLLLNRKLIGLENEKSYVQILEGDMMQKRYVVTGLRNTKDVWIVDGLSEDQKVIAK